MMERNVYVSLLLECLHMHSDGDVCFGAAPGDVFSSLAGVAFEWNLHADTDSGIDVVIPAHSVLR